MAKQSGGSSWQLILDNYNRIVWAILGTILLVVLIGGGLCCLKGGLCSSVQTKVDVRLGE